MVITYKNLQLLQPYIGYLVSTLSDSNLSGHLNQINQLEDIFKTDPLIISICILHCLLCEIDIRKEFFKDDCDNEIQEKPYNAVNKLKEFYQNDSSKIKILTTEMNKVFEYNFGSNYLFKCFHIPVLHLDGEESTFKISIKKISRILNFSPYQLLIFASSQLNCDDSYGSEARNILSNSKLILEKITEKTEITTGVLKNFLKSLNFVRTTDKQRTRVIKLLRGRFNLGKIPADVSLLLYSIPSDENFSRLLESRNILIWPESSCESVNYADLLESLGYSCTTSLSSLKKLFTLFPSVSFSSLSVAKLFGKIINTHAREIQLFMSEQSTWWFLSATNTGQNEDVQPPADSWNIENIVEALKASNPEIDWLKVASCLDYSGFFVEDAESLRILLGLMQATNALEFFLSFALKQSWKHVEAQWSFIKRLLLDSSVSDVPCEKSRAITSDSLFSPLTVTTNRVWASLGLAETLVRLSQQPNLYDEVKDVCLACPCPDILVLSLVNLKGSLTQFQKEVCQTLLQTFFCDLSRTSQIICKVWVVTSQLLLQSLAAFSRSSKSNAAAIVSLAKLLHVPSVLSVLPVSLSIHVAFEPSLLNSNFFPSTSFSGWLTANIKHVDFEKALLLYVYQRLRTGKPPLPTDICVCLVEALDFHYSASSSNSPSLEEYNSIRNLLLIQIPESPFLPRADYYNSYKNNYAKPVLPNSQQPPLRPLARPVEDHDSHTYSGDVEKEAAHFFQQLYSGKLTVNQLLHLLKKKQMSHEKMDRDVYACMIRDLFDEYKYFENYPEKELTLTAVLLGQLIHQQMLPNRKDFLLALRFIVNSIRKKPEFFLFKFGVTAFDQFRMRMLEFPREFPPQFAQCLLETASFVTLFPQFAASCRQFLIQVSQLPSERFKVDKSGVQLPFGSVNNINTLLAAAPPIDIPDDAVVDNVHFIFNNVSRDNVLEKVKDLQSAVAPAYSLWLAQYLVTRRASLEPNIHEIYITVVDAVGFPNFYRMVVDQTYENIKVLLASSKISTSSSERALLKHLGTWLGLITLARNKPILYRNLALKELILDGYIHNALIYILPFVTKVLEAGSKGKVFVPPNPWLMAILRLLKELHLLQDTKLNYKFEIEVLCRALKIDINDIEPSNLLKELEPQKEPSVHSLGDALGREKPESSPATGLGDLFPLHWVISIDPVVDPECKIFLQDVQAVKQSVQAAVERATQDVSPMLERAVFCCSAVAKELILKDFAMESDESKMRTAAQSLARGLGASFSMATCKEALRLSLSNWLKSLLQPLLGASSEDQQKPLLLSAVQTALRDNFDAVLLALEKVVSENCAAILDKLLAASYASRQSHRERAAKPPFCDADRLPDSSFLDLLGSLYPRPDGMTPDQYRVYEDFASINMPDSSLHSQKIGDISSNRISGAIAGPNLLDMSTFHPPGVNPTGTLTVEGDPVLLQHNQALERMSLVMNELCKIVACSLLEGSSNLSSISVTTNFFPFLRQLTIIVIQSNDRANVCIHFARKILQSLFDQTSEKSALFKEMLLLALQTVQDISKKVLREVLEHVKTLLETEKKFNLKNFEVLTDLVKWRLISPFHLDEVLHRLLGDPNTAANSNLFVYCFTVVKATLIREPLPASHLFFPRANLPHTTETLRGSQYLLSLNETSAVLAEVYRQQVVDHCQAQLPSAIPVLARETVMLLFDECIRLSYHHQPAQVDKVYALFIAKIQQQGVLKTDEVQTVFFQVCIEAAVEAACYGSWDKKYEGSISHKPRLNGRPIEALARLMVVLVRMAGCDFKQTNKTTVMANLPVRVQLASKVLHTIVEVMRRDSALLTFRCESGQEKETLNCPPSTRDGAGEVGLALNQRAYYKLFLCLISDLLAPDQLFETIRPQLLTALANALHCLQPKILPGFTFAWLELVSQRQLLTALLRSQKESSLFHMLLLDILEFTAPYLVAVQLNEPLRLLYREVMRLLLVLLHEFPDFLCINYLSLCDILPPSCVQMRNVILSAYPINVRLPNPFLPTLKADWLPELSQSPLISTSATLEILPDYLREKITGYMENKDASYLENLSEHLMTTDTTAGANYNVPVISALVLYVGLQALRPIKLKENSAPPIANCPSMGVFLHLATDLNSEGRYLLLSAIANHLRYPNKHTQYFSCVLLYLFTKASQEAVKEQIARVLVERLIVARPHPWGLLTTFIELIKNPQYDFWSHSFVFCSPKIKNLFESLQESVRHSFMFTQRAQNSLDSQKSKQPVTPLKRPPVDATS